jgi:tRNA (guanosine-2'-O-)-methyltransferase
MPPDLPPWEVIERLDPYLTPDRKVRIERVIAGRTDTVAVVVEGLMNQGNISAVMRTAEALGFHRMHIVEAAGRFKKSARTTQGAEKWLKIDRWSDPESCAAALREAGYRIVVTHLSSEAESIDRFDFTRRTALVFGNEEYGVSERMLALADARCILPMTGFTRSFNISVAAALSLYHAYRDRIDRLGVHGDLGPAEREALQAQYYRLSVRRADMLLARPA